MLGFNEEGMLLRWVNKTKPVGPFSVFLYGSQLTLYRNIMETSFNSWRAMFSADWVLGFPILEGTYFPR